MLERIVQNIVGNAVRYTERGGVVTGCRWGEQFVRIEVWDSGIGIHADQQKEVFSEFYQANSNLSLKREGLGLGLAIVERLCALLRLPITLRSEPDCGTRFTVTIPRVAAGTQPILAQFAPIQAEALYGKSVLVVDDDELVRQSTGGLLESWGCHVILASSGRESIEKLRGQVPDLLISDFYLKGGEQATTLLIQLRQAFGENIPTILMSGDVSATTREHANVLGLTLLDKPVRPMALRALASRLLAITASPFSEAPRAQGSNPAK
jgi:CheY-like chemotaxis protein/anti-sigma regulatory factor (Ser/Thr protein kinase)